MRLLQATSYQLPATLGQHFAYALGRLGVLESQLLKVTDIDRILGAGNAEEAVKMLRDIEFVSVSESAETFLDVLNDSMKLLKENVEKMAPEEKHFIFNILWIDGDRAKISFDLKAKSNFTSDIAVEPLPPVTTGFDVEFDEAFSSPIDIDIAVAKACRDQMLSLAKRSGSRAILNYAELKTELEDARTALRSSEKTDMDAIVFEKEVAVSLGEHLTEMQKMILGPEALFSYAARAQSHIALLKVVLTGKVNNLPIQEIKSLLPPLL